jgi:hypothetical protein
MHFGFDHDVAFDRAVPQVNQTGFPRLAAEFAGLLKQRVLDNGVARKYRTRGRRTSFSMPIVPSAFEQLCFGIPSDQACCAGVQDT